MPLVLLTGSTGFIGAHVLRLLLADDHDYKVRAAIRDMAKADHIKRQHPDKADNIEFVEIKDMVNNPDAFVEAAKGVDYIIHVASPFKTHASNNRKDILEPAINMTKAILKAADASPSVKRLVVTSSFAAIMDPIRLLKGNFTYTSDDWNPVSKSWNPLGTFFISSFYTPLAYLVSKTKAEQTVWSHIKGKKLHYDVTTFCPPMVYGKLEQAVTSADKLNESTLPIYELLDAKQVPKDDFPPFCDVQDVAKCHVLALQNPKASNQRYLLCGGNVSWQKVCDEVHANHPDIANRIPVGKPGTDTMPKPLARLDASKAERDLDIKFTDWKDSVVGALVQLVEMEKTWEK